MSNMRRSILRGIAKKDGTFSRSKKRKARYNGGRQGLHKTRELLSIHKEIQKKALKRG